MELLIVISVLAIMATLTLPSLKFSPKDAEVTKLTELRDTLSSYRAKALSKEKRITLHIKEDGVISVYEGDFYTDGPLGEEKAEPDETITLPPAVDVISHRGDEGDHSLTFYPDGTSSQMHFVLGEDALAFTGAAKAPEILPYESIKP